jgi:hypothetical protein
MSRLRQLTLIVSLTLLIAVCIEPSAVAGSLISGASGRLGYDPDPDQFVIGGQLNFGRALLFFDFTPSLDLGFGEHLTSYCGNFDFRLFKLHPPKSAVALYAAAGPTVVQWDYDGPRSETDVGASIAAGMLISAGNTGHYVLEVRFGLGDVPDLRFIGGIGFGG